MCLEKIMTTIRCLANQGLALRGHESGSENLFQLLSLRSKDVPELSAWLERGNLPVISGNHPGNQFEDVNHSHPETMRNEIRGGISKLWRGEGWEGAVGLTFNVGTGTWLVSPTHVRDNSELAASRAPPTALTGALNPRSTDSSGGNVNLLETALLQAETFFEDLRASLNGSSPENLLSTLRNHSSGILDGLSRFAGELKTEVEAHTGNLSTVLQTASVNINDTLNSLKTPKVQETVSQLQNQFQSGLETLKEESKKVGT
uniref:Uncharacterized protein n=1 Tax=Timema tahoe TaxID=61484 RepID=A0A7R9IMQ3_9NEOP|nr:unnamed protein product [Timema tahoe]